MRSIKIFVTDIFKKPPLLFPLVAMFHVLLLIWLLWSDIGVHFPDPAWVEVLWMIGYTVFWLAACDLRKWGALGYIILTLLDAAIYLGVRNGKIPIDYLSNMFLLDGLFSFFLIFYYKRFV